MPAKLQRITPFLWFDSDAEEAVQLYTSVFPNSRILGMARYGKEGAQGAGRPEGSVMTVEFELDGQVFTAINGGPHFKFTEAISLVVNCDSQAEIDHYWDHLSKGGDAQAQQCGWLKDRFGLSWQVVPRLLAELMTGPDKSRAGRVMGAMLKMKKLDLEALASS